MEGYKPNGLYADGRGAWKTDTLSTYTVKTFLWMFFGLAITFLTAFTGYITGAIVYLFYIPYVHFILLAAELLVVIVLSACLQKLSVIAAQVLFFVYAILNGMVFSVYFLIFEVYSLIYIFLLTAAFFGLLATFGYFTKKNLAGWRPILIAGLLFLLVFWVVSLFLPMTGVERLVCLIGIAIFLGFTAYDTQKIKAYHAAFSANPELACKASIYSALQLYLDFINIFVYLLRIVGRRK